MRYYFSALRADLTTRAAKGIDKNIIQGFGQAAIDSGNDLSETVSFGYKLLRNPEIIENLLDAIEETREALQDPARRAEAIKLIGEALGEGIVGAIDNFSQDKDYYTGYIAASIFDPIGKIGKLGKLSVVFKGIDRIGAKNAVNILLDGAITGKVGKTKQFTKPGGLTGANNAFDSAVGNAPIKNHGRGIRSATLPDGSTISIRPGSTQGSPTIQINPPTGKPMKIRFIGK